MTRPSIAAARFRQRKLSTKQNLQVLREYDIEKSQDDETQRLISAVESGVEKHEEKEHHLQAAISASNAASVGGIVEHIYIPTPHAQPADIKYENFYKPEAHKPSSYIRFSSVVEDCIGASYCMSLEDDQLLQAHNASGATPKITDDQYEQVFSFFEEVAHAKQPFALVDNPPILTLDEIDSAYDVNLDPSLVDLVGILYPVWYEKRLARQNTPLMPILKTIRFESSQEKDDSDPYICFRRRELRTSRKTRARDAQISEKLKRLRMELEDARQLLVVVIARENLKKTLLAADRRLFEQRSQIKQVRRKLNIQGDDEDLVDHRPPKRVKPPAVMLDAPPKYDRKPEAELWLLQEFRNEHKGTRGRFLQEHVLKVQQPPPGCSDWTSSPLSPPTDGDRSSRYLPGITPYLPTPPESAASETTSQSFNFEETSPENNPVNLLERPRFPQLTYRRRIGRGGRIIIDRRGSNGQWAESIDDRVLDRYKYDDSQDSEEDDVGMVDPYSPEYLTWRATLIPSILSARGQKSDSIHFINSTIPNPGGNTVGVRELSHSANP